MPTSTRHPQTQTPRLPYIEAWILASFTSPCLQTAPDRSSSCSRSYPLLLPPFTLFNAVIFNPRETIPPPPQQPSSAWAPWPPTIPRCLPRPLDRPSLGPPSRSMTQQLQRAPLRPAPRYKWGARRSSSRSTSPREASPMSTWSRCQSPLMALTSPC